MAGIDQSRWVSRGNTVRLWRRRATVIMGYAGAFACIAALSIWLSVRVTPLQSVSGVGQRVQVGAAAPDLQWSGPGELDLFGEVIATKPQFDGPIRPRLKLAQITLNAQTNAVTQPGGQQNIETDLSRALTSGWARYLLWQTLIAAGFAALMTVAVAGLRRSSRAWMIKILAATVVGMCALNAAGVYLLAASTPRALRQVRSIEDLVGKSPPATAATGGPTMPGIEAVIIGDSTAAGDGNPLVDHPSTLDRACRRSKDAYAVRLGEVNGWNTWNAACSSATIREGLLGTQKAGASEAPPQLSAVVRSPKASVVIVSVGANDVHWSALAAVCAAADACGDRASTAYFHQQIAAFAYDYYTLLGNLAALPQHPTVLINEYYNPFGDDVGCLAGQGITADKAKVLESRLSDLNAVLREGAQTFGFIDVQQHFDGHRLCSDESFVQGPDADAPLHPTAAGELAIALADQQALAQAARSTNTPSTPVP
ncbi:lysophospholipase L1-like esterase [Streptomyces sp. SPB162]|nr:lysophospholipase L1-like esterase [Streptomyces sp. SPB162]